MRAALNGVLGADGGWLQIRKQGWGGFASFVISHSSPYKSYSPNLSQNTKTSICLTQGMSLCEESNNERDGGLLVLISSSADILSIQLCNSDSTGTSILVSDV